MIAQAGFPGALPFVMHDPGVCQVSDLMTRPSDPGGQVYVLAIHKVGFIKSPDLVQNGFPGKKKRPGKHLDLVVVLFVFQVSQVIAVKQGRMGKKLMKTQHFAGRNPGAGKSAL